MRECCTAPIVAFLGAVGLGTVLGSLTCGVVGLLVALMAAGASPW